jgi:hypothetical protein
MTEARMNFGLEAEAYHGLPRISSGGLKRILQSPAHFRYWKDNPQPPTPAMLFGTVVHTATLEPETLAARIAVVPPDAPDKRSKDGKLWWQGFDAETEGKIVISHDDMQRALTMADAVWSHDLAGGLLDNAGYTEPTGLWRDPATGALCKMRPDYLFGDYSALLDLKTTQDASPEAFARSAWNFRYDMQAAFYIEGTLRVADVMPRHFIWIAVESQPPHGVMVYRAESRVIQKGLEDCERGMEIYARCLAANEWPGYARTVQPLDLPRWAYSRSN